MNLKSFFMTLMLAVGALTGVAQTTSVTTFTATGSGEPIVGTIGSGSRFHQITWVPTSMSACTVKLESSSDGTTWADLIAGQTCTTSGRSALAAGAFNYLRITVTAFTGTSVTVSYQGMSIPPDVTSLTDGTQKTKLIDGSGNVIASTSNALQVSDRETYPKGNYVYKASNGTTDVLLLAANASYSFLVESVSVINANASAGYVVKLCDGACSTANYVAIPAPVAASSSYSGAVIGGLKFNGTKNTALYFACTADCTTNISLSITYRLVP
jgi:hypothetical protein